MRVRTLASGALLLLLAVGAAQAQQADTQAELRAARQQLEDAARRIAELSGTAGPGDFVAIGRRAVLGIGIEDEENGVRVVGVTPGGGADRAGIETGDIVTAMDGAALDAGEGGSPSEVLIAQMDNVDPGDTVVLTIVRDGEPRDVEVEAQASRAQGFAYALPRGRRGEGPRMVPPLMFTRSIGRWADMELVELTPGLGAYFGTEEGVLVVRAPRDETLGLQDGDVILEISGRMPMSVGHALRILSSFEPGEQLELTIMREQNRRTLTVDIPPRANGG
jgi:S1-C subfamily serine protease